MHRRGEVQCDRRIPLVREDGLPVGGPYSSQQPETIQHRLMRVLSTEYIRVSSRVPFTTAGTILFELTCLAKKFFSTNQIDSCTTPGRLDYHLQVQV